MARLLARCARGPRPHRLHVRRRGQRRPPSPRPRPRRRPRRRRGRRPTAARSRARRLLPAVVRRGGRAHQRRQPRALRQGAHHPDLRGRPARPGRPTGTCWPSTPRRSARRSRTGARPSSRRTSGPPRSSCASRCCARSGSPRPIEQSDAGAGVVPLRRHRGAGRQEVAKIDHDTRGALKKPDGPRPSSPCAAPPSRAPRSSTRVLCREDHSWKAISVIDLSNDVGQRPLPGHERGQGRRPDGLCRRRPCDRLRRARLRVGLRVADQGPVAGRPDLRQMLVTRPCLTGRPTCSAGPGRVDL